MLTFLERPCINAASSLLVLKYYLRELRHQSVKSETMPMIKNFVLTSKLFNNTNTSDISVEWLGFLLRIRQIPSSNLGSETSC